MFPSFGSLNKLGPIFRPKLWPWPFLVLKSWLVIRIAEFCEWLHDCTHAHAFFRYILKFNFTYCLLKTGLKYGGQNFDVENQKSQKYKVHFQCSVMRYYIWSSYIRMCKEERKKASPWLSKWEHSKEFFDKKLLGLFLSLSFT